MTEIRTFTNPDLMRRACVARLCVAGMETKGRLDAARKRKGRSQMHLDRLSDIRARILFLETGGDPLDRSFVVRGSL